MTRAVLAVAAFAIAGLLSAFGPYADVRSRLSPRPPLEERPVVNSAEMMALMGSLAEDGRRAYTRQLRWDFVVVGANAAWLWIWLRAVVRRVLGRRLAVIVPAALAAMPALADVTENISLMQVIASHPTERGDVIALAGAATGAKFVFFTGAVATALILSLLVAFKFVRAKAAQHPR
ncbi:MAG: hypothetical protein BroJett001_32710 [Chloroflexota bacterium]|nr:MAG: hypothetical protein BroJett001_32710 [Chloroflexota bacterium]